MSFRIVPMSRDYALEIVAWHYEQPYTFYDPGQDEEDRREFLDAATWTGRLFATLGQGQDHVAVGIAHRRGGTDRHVLAPMGIVRVGVERPVQGIKGGYEDERGRDDVPMHYIFPSSQADTG